MLNQKTDLHAIRLVLKQLHYLVDAIEVERHHNATQDHQLSEHEHRISVIEKTCEEMLQILSKNEKQMKTHKIQLQEYEESIDCVVNKVKQFEHLKNRNEDIEALAAFYLQDD